MLRIFVHAQMFATFVGFLLCFAIWMKCFSVLLYGCCCSDILARTADVGDWLSMEWKNFRSISEQWANIILKWPSVVYTSWHWPFGRHNKLPPKKKEIIIIIMALCVCAMCVCKYASSVYSICRNGLSAFAINGHLLLLYEHFRAYCILCAIPFVPFATMVMPTAE